MKLSVTKIKKKKKEVGRRGRNKYIQVLRVFLKSALEIRKQHRQQK